MWQHNEQQHHQQYKVNDKRSNNATAITNDPEHAGRKANGTNNLDWKQNAWLDITEML